MSGLIVTIPKYQFLSAAGVPLAGGTLETYLAGTSTPAATYADRDLTTSNGTTITLDARGECVLWRDPSVTYKFILKNQLGVIQWTVDNIGGADADSVNVIMDGYSDLRAYSGAATVVFLTDSGVRGAFVLDEDDVSSDDDGGTIIVDDNDGRWKRLYSGPVHGEWFSILGNGTNESTKLQDAWAVTDIVDLGTLDVYAPDVSHNDVKDKLAKGEGELTGIDRIQSYGEYDGRWSAPAGDLTNAHLPRFRRTKDPIVVFIGDSIGTYFANTRARTDMVAVMVERKFREACSDEQTMTFYNRAIGGYTWGRLMNNDTTADSDVAWWDTGTILIDQIEALQPDVIVAAFGMNDRNDLVINDGIKSFYDTVLAWDKAPDIVLCTNLNPSMGEDLTNGRGLIAEQNERDFCAGWVRGFAKFHKLGLLDFGRAFNVARDGFDPMSSACLKDGETVSFTSGTAEATGETRDFRTSFTVNLNTFVAGDAAYYVAIQLGPDSFDWCKLVKTGGGTLRFTLTTGHIDAALNSDAYQYAAPEIAWPAGTTKTFTAEVKGEYLTIYDETLNGFGQYNDPMLSTKIIRGGGLFTPSVFHPAAYALVSGSADFYQYTNRKYKPLVKDADLFGAGDYFGSSYNHPGDLLAKYVYQPVIDAAEVVSQYAEGIVDGISLMSDMIYSSMSWTALNTVPTYSDIDYVLSHGANVDNNSVFRVPEEYYASSLRIHYVADNTGGTTQALSLEIAASINGTVTILFIGTLPGLSAVSGTHTYIECPFTSTVRFNRGDQISFARHGNTPNDTYGLLRVNDLILI